MKKTEFMKLYEELNNTWVLSENKTIEDEDTLEASVKSVLSFETDLANIKSMSADELKKVWPSIRDISNRLRNKFCSQTKQRVSWPYQFQLMYNAYQTELRSLELLENAEFRNALNKALLEQKINKQVCDKYVFNENPHKHDEFSASSSNPEKKTVVDILAVGNISDNILKDVEVKATTSSKLEKPKSFHGAELIFVFILDTDTLNVYLRTDLLNNEEPVVNKVAGDYVVVDADIKSQSDLRNSNSYSCVYTTKADVRSKCIKVFSELVHTIDSF